MLFVIVLFSYTVQSQTYVTGTLDSAKNYSWIALYKLKGAKQLYVKNAAITNGEFSIEIPTNASIGMYRLAYGQQNGYFIDFIYNNENVKLKFNPENPSESVEFLISEENKIFQNYLYEFAVKQQKLDSFQLSFFKLKDEHERTISNNLYAISRSNFNEFQLLFEKETEGKLSNHFIESSNKYYAPKLIETPQEYLNSEKLHFFDFINFNDQELRNSTFINKKIVDYIFYLNGSDDAEVQNILYKNAVQEVLNKIDDIDLKSEVLTSLLYTFSQIENIVLIDFIIEDFYNKLPETYRSAAVINDIKEKVKLAIGKNAPDFSWEEEGESKNLHQLNKAATYVLVFWSTGCSHCIVEVPELYEYTKGKSDIHVVNVALEKDTLGFDIYSQQFEKWTNVLGLGKWQNPIAKNYNIVSTPTYFILDTNKKIIAKPEFLKDVKAFFEN